MNKIDSIRDVGFSGSVTLENIETELVFEGVPVNELKRKAGLFDEMLEGLKDAVAELEWLEVKKKTLNKYERLIKKAEGK